MKQAETLPELTTLQQAAHLIGLPEETLMNLARLGRIKVARFNGDLLVPMSEIDKTIRIYVARKRVPHVDKVQFTSLEGIPIHMSEASRKYGLPVGSISNWSQRGHIRILGRDEHDRRRVYVNEADVAFAKELGSYGVRGEMTEVGGTCGFGGLGVNSPQTLWRNQDHDALFT